MEHLLPSFSRETLPQSTFSENPEKISACSWDQIQYRYVDL